MTPDCEALELLREGRDLRRRRDALIRRAHAKGQSVGRIAVAAGLTVRRVQAIVSGR